MRKSFTYHTLFLLMLAGGFGTSYSQRVEKELQETFNADKSTLLEVDSKFGEVHVMAWDENKVEVNVNIWVESNNQDKAVELLSDLDAEVSFSGNRIIVSSVLPEKLNTRKETQFSIDFNIYAPKFINLDLSSKYGSVFIDEVSGSTDIKVSYGNLKVLELNRDEKKPLNHINLAYSSGSIEEAGWLKVDLAYSKLSVDEATAIMVISKYSGLTVDECSSLVMDSKYDTYSIGEINNFLGELKYCNLKIEELEKKLEIVSAYTSVKVEEIDSEFEMIKIDNSRGGYKLGISKNASFNLSGTAIHGDISISGMDNLNKKAENSNKFIDGQYGNNPSSTIDLQVREGSIKIAVE